MTIEELNTRQNQARMTTVERLEAASIPSKLSPQYRTILTAAQTVEKLLSEFNAETDKVNSNTLYSGEGRTKLLNDLVADYRTRINDQADIAQTAYETALESFTSGHKDFTPSSSDVLLTDASTRLHFMARKANYLSEHTFIDFYRNAVTDGDNAMADWIRLQFKSLVRQYTGKEARHPEKLFLETLSDADQNQYKQALNTMDVGISLRQQAHYKLQ